MVGAPALIHAKTDYISGSFDCLVDYVFDQSIFEHRHELLDLAYTRMKLYQNLFLLIKECDQNPCP